MKIFGVFISVSLSVVLLAVATCLHASELSTTSTISMVINNKTTLPVYAALVSVMKKGVLITADYIQQIEGSFTLDTAANVTQSFDLQRSVKDFASKKMTTKLLLSTDPAFIGQLKKDEALPSMSTIIYTIEDLPNASCSGKLVYTITMNPKQVLIISKTELEPMNCNLTKGAMLQNEINRQAQTTPQVTDEQGG